MNLRHLTAAAAAGMLVATPIAANAAPIERAGAPVAESSDLGGGSDIVKALIIILIAAAGMAFLLLTDDDEPDSP